MSDIIPVPRRKSDLLAKLRAAVAAWQASPAQLRGATMQLRGSLEAYDRTLSTLSGRVDALHSSARRLETWADGILR